jgi:hypothetical protein
VDEYHHVIPAPQTNTFIDTDTLTWSLALPQARGQDFLRSDMIFQIEFFAVNRPSSFDTLCQLPIL